MTDQSDPDFSDDETTQTDASAPLVDYGNTPAEMTAETVETDMSTMPETRSAAQRTLAREVDEERQRMKVRNFPHGPGPSVRASTDIPLVRIPTGATVGRVSAPEAIPPRRPEESRSLASRTTEIIGCTFDSRPRGDMKAGLTSSRPKLSIVPAAGELYQCRAMEYGADKYRRGNYHGTPPAGVSSPARVVGYVDAAIRHLRAVADAYNRECATADDPAGLPYSDALGARDDVASGGFPASGLPHLAHAMASIALAIQCGVDDGLLPADPGQPWKGGKVTEDRSPEAATRFSAANKALGDVVSALGPVIGGEPLWHGYRQADVLALARTGAGQCWPGLSYEIRDGKVGWYGSGGDWIRSSTTEREYRAAGLRRPDEPDYKPLA